jgi:hypothetical protein
LNELNAYPKKINIDKNALGDVAEFQCQLSSGATSSALRNDERRQQSTLTSQLLPRVTKRGYAPQHQL